MPEKIEYLDVANLRLDPENPRLPESVQGGNQSELLGYLFEYGALEELAQSYLDNGFFDHEPLIVLKPRNKEKRHTVLEGNRRLGTLMILHGFEEAEELDFTGITATRAQLQKLREIPCYQIENREDVHSFLGFRHIGGIKAWAPEAKARYIVNEVSRATHEGVTDAFKVVGRRVGSNAQGVRNPYIALRILQHGRDEYGLDITYVQQKRFGVWLRCMNSADIRDYIGFGTARTYDEVENGIDKVDVSRLDEVLKDLTPQEGHAKALLWDSRDVTDYGRIITNKRAATALRKYADIALARTVIDELNLPQRIERITESCKLIVDELHGAEGSPELEQAAEGLHGVARSIRDIVKGKARRK
jgi:hypothetical protein